MKAPIFLISAMLISTIGISQKIEFPSLGSGIQYTSQDSATFIKMSARIQNLAVVEYGLTPGGADPDVSAMTRRARLKFDGYALTKKISYKIELGLSNRDTRYADDSKLVGGNARIILDAVLKYELVKGTTLWFGQTKLPGNRERVISSQKLQFVDRSLLNSRFNIDRDFGFQLHTKAHLGDVHFRFKEAVSMGEGRNVITDNSGGFEYTARIECLPFGEFTDKGDYFSSDLKRESKPKLAFGLTGDLNQKSIRQGGQLGKILTDTAGRDIQADLVTFLGDMIFKYNGFSTLIEVAYRESSRANIVDANGLSYREGFAYSGQAGYLFKTNYEIAGRYTRTATLENRMSGVDNIEQYTLGVSKYFRGHNLKNSD